MVILIINVFWKISVHSMGIAAPLAVLFYVNIVAAIILGCVLIIVMWSRVHLKKHSISQVLGGALLGFLFTGFQLFLLKILLL
jgi:membrane-associated phospholipid phosphatase